MATAEWRRNQPERAREAARRWRREHPEYDHEAHRLTPRDNAARSKSYAKNNPEKVAAHNAVYRAVQAGHLTPGGCEKCGASAEAHHDDYSKPLEVRWLCRRHHREHHLLEAA